MLNFTPGQSISSSIHHNACLQIFNQAANGNWLFIHYWQIQQKRIKNAVNEQHAPGNDTLIILDVRRE